MRISRRVDRDGRADPRVGVDEPEGKLTVENRLLLGQACLDLYARRRGLYRVSWQHVEHFDCGPKIGMRSSWLDPKEILSFLSEQQARHILGLHYPRNKRRCSGIYPTDATT